MSYAAAYQARYREEHREERAAKQRAYYAEHRETRLAKQAAYSAEHRAEKAAYDALYRAKHHGEKEREYREWLRIYTSTHTCDICGGPPTLWHHVDPSTKRADVAAMPRYSLDSIEAELEKCVPMCSPCHTRMHVALRRAARLGATA